MRKQFDEQLEKLNNELIDMGALCESAIADAIKSFGAQDRSFAGRIEKAEKEIDASQRSIDMMCMKLLLRQQPVAKDLRLVTAASKMATDMERIGDQALDMAELAQYCDLSGDPAEKEIYAMTAEVINMLVSSIDAFVKRDTQAAADVIERDDTADSMFGVIRNILAVSIESRQISGAQALDTLMTAKYLERIGDHATNIAEQTIFAVTGKI
jgi:phosphate transport system protein